jgi:hypothetical protein
LKGIKSKIIVGLILLIIILPTKLSISSLCSFNGYIEPKNEDYTINNIIYLYDSFYDISLDNSLIYLIGYQDLEIFDASDPYNIVKIKEIIGEPILDLARLEHIFYDIDLNNNSIHTYGLTSECLYGEIYYFNETHITDFENFQYNISLGDNFKSYKLHKKNDSTLLAIIENKLIDENSLISWLNITMLTFDFVNKTKPEILSKQTIFYEEDFITWIDNQQEIYDRITFHLSNNLLFLVRIYRDFDSGELIFNSGFIEIWDIGDSSNPLKLATINVDNGGDSFVMLYDYLLIYYTKYSGFNIYNISDINNIKKINSYSTDSILIQLISDINVLYILSKTKFEIFDISNPNEITKSSQYIPRFQGLGSFKKGVSCNNFLFLIRKSEFQNRNFFIFDCSDLSSPKKIIPNGFKLSSSQKSKLFMSLTYAGFILGFIVVITLTTIMIIKTKKKNKLKSNRF